MKKRPKYELSSVQISVSLVFRLCCLPVESFGVIAGVICARLSTLKGLNMFENRFPKYFEDFLSKTLGEGVLLPPRKEITLFLLRENGVENKDLN